MASMSSNEISGSATGPNGETDRSYMTPWVILPLLTVIGILNMIDRILPSILAETIKNDLVISDMLLGIINGAAFLMVYAVSGIFIARLSDRGHYGRVICVCLALWSAMTMVCAWVAAGWQLALARLGVALGEAGASPAAHAYITRNFPAHRRTRGLAVFTMSLPMGSMIGFALGGYLGEVLGWRRTFLVIGLFGIVLAFVAWLVFPKAAGAAQRKADLAGEGPGLAFLLSRPSAIAIILGQSFTGMGAYAAMAFGPAFMIRLHGMSLGDTGLLFGVYTGVFGVALLGITGWLSDRLSVWDLRWLPGIAAVLTLAGLPFAITGIMTASPPLAVIGFALACVIPAATVASAIAALHLLAPLNLRARASAVLLSANSVLGSFGPFIVGFVSDRLKTTHGTSALAYGLWIVPICYVLGALAFVAAMFAFRKDMAASLPPDPIIQGE